MKKKFKFHFETDEFENYRLLQIYETVPRFAATLKTSKLLFHFACYFLMNSLHGKRITWEQLVWCTRGLKYLVDDWGINKSFLFFPSVGQQFLRFLCQNKVWLSQFTKFVKNEISGKLANKFERQQKEVFRLKTSRD